LYFWYHSRRSNKYVVIRHRLLNLTRLLSFLLFVVVEKSGVIGAGNQVRCSHCLSASTFSNLESVVDTKKIQITPYTFSASCSHFLTRAPEHQSTRAPDTPHSPLNSTTRATPTIEIMGVPYKNTTSPAASVKQSAVADSSNRKKASKKIKRSITFAPEISKVIGTVISREDYTTEEKKSCRLVE
jgi:hypothetical protein